MCGRKSMKLKVDAGDNHRKRCWTTFSMLSGKWRGSWRSWKRASCSTKTNVCDGSKKLDTHKGYTSSERKLDVFSDAQLPASMDGQITFVGELVPSSLSAL